MLIKALSGVNLPRGEGIQTRFPLVLQLCVAVEGEEDEHRFIWIESLDADPERIGLDEISENFREYMALPAGEGKDVRDFLIEMKIYWQYQDNMMLMDLPRITRVALSDQEGVGGNKLEAIILGMRRRYMRPKQSIVLKTFSAMVDLSTSASL